MLHHITQVREHTRTDTHPHSGEPYEIKTLTIINAAGDKFSVTLFGLYGQSETIETVPSDLGGNLIKADPGLRAQTTARIADAVTGGKL
jgi:hypothetical protein